MTWVLFDYGNVICQPQPERDVARLAEVAGCAVADLLTPYWAYRLDYDRAALDVTGYWQQVAADLGGSFTGPQIAELSRLDAGSWLHLRPASVDLVAGLAAAGVRLAGRRCSQDPASTRLSSAICGSVKRPPRSAATCCQ